MFYYKLKHWKSVCWEGATVPAGTRLSSQRVKQHFSVSNKCWLFSVVAAQQLHAQGDPLVPLPGDHSHISGVERGLKQILLVAVVVNVALEKLQIKD